MAADAFDDIIADVLRSAADGFPALRLDQKSAKERSKVYSTKGSKSAVAARQRLAALKDDEAAEKAIKALFEAQSTAADGKDEGAEGTERKSGSKRRRKRKEERLTVLEALRQSWLAHIQRISEESVGRSRKNAKQSTETLPAFDMATSSASSDRLFGSLDSRAAASKEVSSNTAGDFTDADPEHQRRAGDGGAAQLSGMMPFEPLPASQTEAEAKILIDRGILSDRRPRPPGAWDESVSRSELEAIELELAQDGSQLNGDKPPRQQRALPTGGQVLTLLPDQRLQQIPRELYPVDGLAPPRVAPAPQFSFLAPAEPLPLLSAIPRLNSMLQSAASTQPLPSLERAGTPGGFIAAAATAVVASSPQPKTGDVLDEEELLRPVLGVSSTLEPRMRTARPRQAQPKTATRRSIIPQLDGRNDASRSVPAAKSPLDPSAEADSSDVDLDDPALADGSELSESEAFMESDEEVTEGVYAELVCQCVQQTKIRDVRTFEFSRGFLAIIDHNVGTRRDLVVASLRARLQFK